MDVTDTTRVGLDDHGVDQFDQGVVRLCHGLVVIFVRTRAVIDLHAGQQVGATGGFVGEGIAGGLTVSLPVTEAKLVVGGANHRHDLSFVRQGGDDPDTQQKFQLLNHHPSRGVNAGNHHQTAARQQGYDRQTTRSTHGNFGQRGGFDGKFGDINHRITHLASQRRVQLGARQAPHLNQQFAQRQRTDPVLV